VLRGAIAVAATAAVAVALLPPGPARSRRQLPAGVVEVTAEMAIPANTELVGAPGGTTLRAAANFRGRALVVCTGANIRLRNFTVDGNRAALEVRAGLPPSNQPFARFTANNGVLAVGISNLRIEDVRFREIAGFAVLVSAGHNVAIARVTVEDSGSRNARGRNNSTGGILLEEGTAAFSVTGCTLRRIRGNGIWTHSLYTSPRNAWGRIEDNRLDEIGRDALQAGHAHHLAIRRNSGSHIGFPLEDVDMEAQAIPVGIDTAGNVDRSIYAANRFEEIDGKCIDLDGFHDGEIAQNVCINRGGAERYPWGGYGIVMNNTNPDMQSENIRIWGNEIRGAKFGGIFIIGTGHSVTNNRLLGLNTAHCNEEAARFGCYYAAGEPEMLSSGIYLGRRAERPARAAGNTVEGNTITGFKMAARCIGRAPGIEAAANTVAGNTCRDE
jgi:hypothetical protein